TRAGEHMRTIAGSGWGKKEIRQFLFESTKNTVAHLKRTHRIPGEVQPGDETKLRPIVAEPDDILVIAAGGRAGSFSSFIPGWGGARSSLATTQEVKRWSSFWVPPARRRSSRSATSTGPAPSRASGSA